MGGITALLNDVVTQFCLLEVCLFDCRPLMDAGSGHNEGQLASASASREFAMRGAAVKEDICPH